MSATASNHIHPIFGELATRAERESFLHQKSKVIWMTGLSGAGKSTIAAGLEKRLLEQRFFTQVLDGDNFRAGLNGDLSFSLADRKENIRRVAEVAKLYLQSGIITICTFISPTVEIRQFAKNIIGEEDFIEVYVSTPMEICEERDVKGLYQKARSGEILDFTGIHSPYEPPIAPALTLQAGQENVAASVQRAFDHLLPFIQR